jgi:hypothetical protein
VEGFPGLRVEGEGSQRELVKRSGGKAETGRGLDKDKTQIHVL